MKCWESNIVSVYLFWGWEVRNQQTVSSNKQPLKFFYNRVFRAQSCRLQWQTSSLPSLQIPLARPLYLEVRKIGFDWGMSTYLGTNSQCVSLLGLQYLTSTLLSTVLFREHKGWVSALTEKAHISKPTQTGAPTGHIPLSSVFENLIHFFS